MKKKKSKKLAKVMALALAGALTLTGSPLNIQQLVSAQTATSVSSKDILSTLTPEQRKAIQEITAGTSASGIQLSSEMDLTSKEEISILVEFKSHVPKTAVVAAQLNGKMLSLEDAKAKVEKEHALFKNDLEKLNVKAKITGAYKEAYNGVAMTLPASQVKRLLQSNAVKSIWENKQVELLHPVTNAETGSGSVYTGAHPHSMTGVDKLQEKGLTGNGVKVAVLDTGIDYNHPDLKGAYKGGYDFVDEDADPMESTYEDWKNSGLPEFNPSAYYTSHGTHVSGIIAGQGTSESSLSVKGVAPGADLHVYRVLGPYGRGTTEDIMQGIEQSVKDKMDVINLSLGNVLNDPLSPLSVSINNAVISGVTSVLAAGNSGPSLYTVGSPASSALGISVGSTNTEVSYPHFKGKFQSASLVQDLDIRYSTTALGFDPRSLKDSTLPVVNVGKGLTEDYVGRDVKGKIVLMTTGGTSRISDKVLIAKKQGAAAVFVYSPYPGYIGDRYPEDPKFIPTYILEGNTGKKLSELLLTEEATFTFNSFTEEMTTKDDTVSFFSSSGPTRLTYDIKPEIVAPGAGILSTVPLYYHQLEDYEQSYAKFSGTSMATPHIAGIAALLLEANPKSEPGEIKANLMNTADDLKANYSVFDLGAGRADAVEALDASLQIRVEDETPSLKNNNEKEIRDITGALSFGTKYVTGTDIQDERSITIENLSDQAKSYSVEVSFNVNARGSKDAVKNGVKLETLSTVELKAKENVKTKVSLLIPETAELGIYEGYVIFTNKENPNESYQVPFAVRKVKEGVEYLNSGDTLSTIRENGYGRLPNISGEFYLNSHMKNIDIFLVDANQEKEIGYLGYIDGRFLSEKTPLRLWNYFSGYYYPLTDDKEHPVAYESKLALPGAYKLKFIFQSESGKEIEIEKPVIIDNEMPTVKTNVNEKIVEVDPTQTTFEVSGQVEDKQIVLSNEYGVAVTQGHNRVGFRTTNSYPENIPVNEKGEFTLKRSFPSYLKVMPLRITGMDRAGLDSVQEEHFYVRAGVPYLATVPERDVTMTGESLKLKASLHYVEAWKELSFVYNFNKDVIDVAGITLVEELQNKAEVVVEEVASGLKVTLKSKDGAEIVTNDKTNLFDINVQLKDGSFFSNYLDLKASSVKATKGDGSAVIVEGISPSFKVWSSYSEITGDMNGEAVFYRDAYGRLQTTHIDYQALGASIKAVDQRGKEYPAEIITDGRFKISNLPSTQEEMSLYFEVPGHFTVVKHFNVGRETNYGEQKFVNFFPALAGDANHDQLIDIKDAVYLAEKWGTNDRNGDFNFDDTIDMEDMEYIKQHYLLFNPMVQVKDKPVDKDKGRTLWDVIGELE